MSNGGNVARFPSQAPPTPKPAGGGGGGDGSDRRLAAIESRLTALETAFDRELKHLATKEDIQKIKVWVLGGALGASGITITLAKLLAN